jgi:RNA polymerase sigma-70 factor (ECF subfamily)
MPGPDFVSRFRAGDPDAVRELYAEYGRRVWAVAFRALGDRSLAEEAVQQTFLQAWKAAGSFDETRDVGPWLFTIVRRVAVDLYRRESRRPHEGLDGVAESEPALVTLPADVERAAQSWEVREAVDVLPDGEREVVHLQHFGGLSHDEIAERLGVPVGTVKSRSFRAHRRLAERLGHLREVAS